MSKGLGWSSREGGSISRLGWGPGWARVVLVFFFVSLILILLNNLSFGFNLNVFIKF